MTKGGKKKEESKLYTLMIHVYCDLFGRNEKAAE